MKKSALIIANWQYEDPLLRTLVSPSKDAESLAQVLGDAAIGGFEVQVLTNVPSYRVSEETEAFFGDRGRDDLLLFYFSGHGVTDDDGQLYYAASNTLHKRLRSTAVAASWVNDVMNQCQSRRQVMLLDCCHSGAFARTKSAGTVNTGKYFTGATPEQGRGKFILTACDAFQYSFEGEAIEGVGTNSVFTDAIIQGLRTGGADADGDGLITLDELYDYVFQRMRDRTPQQTPRKWASDVEGSVVIASNPNPVEAPLPEDLQAAIDSFVAEIREKSVARLGKLLRGKHRGLGLSANKTLLTLAMDDSRRVSASAEKCLADFDRDRASGLIRTDRFESLPPSVLSPTGEASHRKEGALEIVELPREQSTEHDTSQLLQEMAQHAVPKADESGIVHEPAPSRLAADISAPATRHAPVTQAPTPLPNKPTLDAWSEPARDRPPVIPERPVPEPAPLQPASVRLPPSKWSSEEERSAQLRSFGKSLVAKVAEDDTLKPYVTLPARTRPADLFSFNRRSMLVAAGALAAVLGIAAIAWLAFAPKHTVPEASVQSASVDMPDQQKARPLKMDQAKQDKPSPQPVPNGARSEAPEDSSPPPDHARSKPPVSALRDESPSTPRGSPVLNASVTPSINVPLIHAPPPQPSVVPTPSTTPPPSNAAPAAHTSFKSSGVSPAPSSSLPKPPTDPAAPIASPQASNKTTSTVIESSDFAKETRGGPPSLHITLTPEQARTLLLSRSPATYPAVARAAGVTGTVVIDTHVSRKGAVLSLDVLDGPPLLRDAALDALKTWRFKPYKVNGDAVEWRTTINIGFTLLKDSAPK